MENNEKLTAERSLEVISEAIKASRREAGRSVGTLMTVWGTLALVTGCAITWLWSATGDSRWNWLWAAAALAAYINYRHIEKQERLRHTADTFATKVIKWIWSTFFGVTAGAVIFSFDFVYDETAVAHLTIYPIIIFLLTLASGTTAMITSNGAGCGSAIMAAYMAKAAAEEGGCAQAVCMAAACVFALLIPGLLMKYKTWMNKQQQ